MTGSVITSTGSLLLTRAHALINPSRSSVKVCCLEIEMRRLLCSCTIFILFVPWADSIPSLRLLLHEVSRINLCKAAPKFTISDHIEASVNFFCYSHSRNLMERHLVESLLLSEGLVPNRNVHVVLGLKALFLVCLSLISFLQPVLIIDYAVDWIVKHAITLNDGRELLHHIFAMIFCLVSPICLELIFNISVHITDRDWVKVMCFPVLLSSFVFKNFLIDLHLFFMVLQVAVIDHIIVSLACSLNCFPTNSLFKKLKVRHDTVKEYYLRLVLWAWVVCQEVGNDGLFGPHCL